MNNMLRNRNIYRIYKKGNISNQYLTICKKRRKKTYHYYKISNYTVHIQKVSSAVVQSMNVYEAGHSYKAYFFFKFNHLEARVKTFQPNNTSTPHCYPIVNLSAMILSSYFSIQTILCLEDD